MCLLVVLVGWVFSAFLYFVEVTIYFYLPSSEHPIFGAKDTTTSPNIEDSLGLLGACDFGVLPDVWSSLYLSITDHVSMIINAYMSWYTLDVLRSLSFSTNGKITFMLELMP